ncbi:MAG: type II toxin-antitoxin system HicA family toxin [bacterium]
MKIPRDISGDELAKKLKRFGYDVTRKTGSHMRLTTCECGEHHITIPQHKALRIGTLAEILVDIASHFKIDRETLQKQLFK